MKIYTRDAIWADVEYGGGHDIPEEFIPVEDYDKAEARVQELEKELARHKQLIQSIITPEKPSAYYDYQDAIDLCYNFIQEEQGE